MLLKPLFRHGEGQRAIGAQLLVHGLDILIESCPDIDPQDGLLTVVDIGPGLGMIDVLQIVGEHQRAFVVDADGGIEVIGQREPLAPGHEGREHILGPAVHHQEQLREQVIKKHGILFKMLCEFGFELGQTVLRSILRVENTIVGAAHQQVIPGGGGLIGAFQPCGQFRQIDGIGKILRVSCFKVALPVRTGIIIGFPEDAVAGVVENLPAFIPLGKAEHLRGGLIEVEVVFSNEAGGGSVIPENHDWETVNGLADFAVLLLGSRLEGTGILIEPGQFHIVGTLGGSHIRLEGEGVGRHGVRAQLIGLLRVAAGVHKTTLELDLVVLPGVILRGRTLDIHLGSGEGKRAAGIDGIGVVAAHHLYIALVLGQFRAVQHQVRQILRQLGYHDLRVGVKHMVAAVPLQHGFHHLGVRDPVVQNLVPGQVVVIDADAVQVDGGIPGADGDIHRHNLGKVIIRRVLHHTGHDAAQVAVNQPIGGFLLHHESQAQMLVFLVPGGDFLLLRAQGCQLGRDGDAAIAAHTGQHHRVVIHNIPGGELDLDGLAGGTEVLSEGLHRNGQCGIAGHTENRDIVLVQLPSVRGEVEAGEAGGDRAILPYSRVLFGVAPTGAGQIQRKAFRFRFNLHLTGGDSKVDGSGDAPTGNLQGQFTGIVSAIRPDLLGTVYRLTGHHIAVHRKLHFCGQTGRIIDGKRNRQ